MQQRVRHAAHHTPASGAPAGQQLLTQRPGSPAPTVMWDNRMRHKTKPSCCGSVVKRGGVHVAGHTSPQNSHCGTADKRQAQHASGPTSFRPSGAVHFRPNKPGHTLNPPQSHCWPSVPQPVGPGTWTADHPGWQSGKQHHHVQPAIHGHTQVATDTFEYAIRQLSCAIRQLCICCQSGNSTRST